MAVSKQVVFAAYGLINYQTMKEKQGPLAINAPGSLLWPFGPAIVVRINFTLMGAISLVSALHT